MIASHPRRSARPDHRRLHAGRAARVVGRRHGGDARADPARREAPASRRAADLEPAGRPAHRRRLRRDAGDVRGQPRRVRPGAAFHRRDPRRGDPHEGRDLPGALRRVAGGREGRAVHAAARAHRLRPARASAGLARDRQSVRQQRSDRAAARDQAGCRAVPRRRWPTAKAMSGSAATASSLRWRMPPRARIVTVEKIHDGNLFDDPALAAGTLRGFYVERSRVAPRGAWPLALADHYPATARTSPNMPRWRRPRRLRATISTQLCACSQRAA